MSQSAAPTLVSLFAGIGGFDLGLERAGFRTIGQCEIDPDAVSVLERHWPAVPRHADVTTLGGMAFGPADVVTFGSPCQDLSTAGRREGLAGERSGLFRHAMRYVREMQEATNHEYPRTVIWENVTGALSTNGGRDFGAVLSSMVGGPPRDTPERGWPGAGVAFGPQGALEWRVLNSQYFGVPQRRRRVFVIYRPHSRRAGEILLERQSVPRHPRASEEARPVIAGSLTASAGGPSDNEAQANYLVPAAFHWANGPQHGMDVMPVSPTLRTTVAPAVAFALRGRSAGAQPELSGGVTSALRGSAGGSSRDYVAARSAVRRLMPIETERLQGFPDDWTRYRADGSEISDTARYRLTGNAVTVSVIEWIAGRLPLDT